MVPILDELRGKVVVVTGGNRGIGSGCAEAFCRFGFHVVIAARDKQRGEETAETITGLGPGTCVFSPCDVSDADQVSGLVAYAFRTYGRLDCMVNNAGYLPKRRRIDDISIRDFEDILRTNLIGVFSGCKYSLPYLRRTKGCIINMSSILGIVGQEGSSIYSATKGAIISLTKSLAIDEAGSGVRVNAVLPGNIGSELGRENRDDSISSEQGEDLSTKAQWIRRQGTALEIGWTCVFLASGMASYITGAEIYATGGFEMGNGIRLTREELVQSLHSISRDAVSSQPGVPVGGDQRHSPA
jgi:NAD(P)-dependent dehydrogenase (short-subunit alcohol dehydrogenase family)